VILRNPLSQLCRFLVLPIAYAAKTRAPIFTQNTQEVAVLRKDVPFWGRETSPWHFNPLSPQNRQFGGRFWTFHHTEYTALLIFAVLVV